MIIADLFISLVGNLLFRTRALWWRPKEMFMDNDYVARMK
jgi:hypothetical protein